MNTKHGFSIKSAEDVSPILLHASPATRFVYEVKGSCMDGTTADVTHSINAHGTVMDRVNAIYDNGFRFAFADVPHSVFRENLRMIDSNLPTIVGWMLQDAYQSKDMGIQNAVMNIRKANPLGYELGEGHDPYGYKVKSLLAAIALGMQPAITWDGRHEATCGFFVVKEDGGVASTHTYERNMLEDYLYTNTKFETPEATNRDFGYVYQEGDKLFFDLVMQIVFI